MELYFEANTLLMAEEIVLAEALVAEESAETRLEKMLELDMRDYPYLQPVRSGVPARCAGRRRARAGLDGMKLILMPGAIEGEEDRHGGQGPEDEIGELGHIEDAASSAAQVFGPIKPSAISPCPR